jgi:hypothetical protein
MTDNRGDTWTKSPGISGQIEGISLDTRRLYCSGLQGLMRYNESSQTWTSVPINGTNPYIRDIVFVGDVMFVQSESGMLKSDDDGATWTTVDSEASFFDMSARHTALYRSRDDGFSQSLDSGATWEVIGDIDAPAIQFVFSDKNVFARFDKRIWYRSLEEFAPPFVEADTTFSADEPLVITFDHEPYTLEGEPLTQGDLDDLIVIVDSEGNEVPFEATLSEDHLSITIVIEDPKSGESYTINVAPVQSAAGIQSKGQTITANAEVVTGIDENPNVKISVHPNPFEHHVTISFGDTDGSLKSAALFDTTGKQVTMFGANEGDLSLDGAHLKPGMYVLKVSIGNRVYVRKAVKN